MRESALSVRKGPEQPADDRCRRSKHERRNEGDGGDATLVRASATSARLTSNTRPMICGTVKPRSIAR